MARGDKKAKVAKYLKDHPDAKNGDTAKACGCSVPMVSSVKRELGLTRGSTRRKALRRKAARKQEEAKREARPSHRRRRILRCSITWFPR